MKKSLLVVGALLVLPAVALASPKLMLTYGGTGTTPNTDTTTTAIAAPAGAVNFWLNVVMLDDEGYVGAFGGGLDVNAAGTDQLKYLSAVVSSYTYYDEELFEDVTVECWDRVATISTSSGNIGARDAVTGNLVNIGLYSKTEENPPAAAFPIVESIRVRLLSVPTSPIVVSFADPGGGLNWGCLAASAPAGQPLPGGNFAAGDLSSFTILPAILPEPVSLVLLAVGGLFLRRRVA